MYTAEASAPSIVSSQVASIGVNSFFSHSSGHPFAMTSASSAPPSPASPAVPVYMQSVFVITVALAVMIVVIACSIAFVYIRFEEKKVALIHAGYAHGVLSQSASRNFQYMSGCPSPSSTSLPSRVGGGSIVSDDGGLTLRYPDATSRPLLARPPVPTVLWAQQQGPIREEDSDAQSSCNPYSTLPFQRRMQDTLRTHQTIGRTDGPPPLPSMPRPKSQRFSGCTFGHLLPSPLSPDTSSPVAMNTKVVSADLHNHARSPDGEDEEHNHLNQNESCKYYDVNSGVSDQNSGQSVAELLPAPNFTHPHHHHVSRSSQI